MRQIERSTQRDEALVALLPQIETHGWTQSAMRAGLVASGQPPDAAAYLFNGAPDMIEAYIDFADRRMEQAAASLDEPRLSKRIRAVIALRLAQAGPERPAIRRALALLALPTNAAVAARSLARTVDSIWHAAGDTSADFSWYTKRATLAAVYTATLLQWLNQDPYADPDDAETLAFLDRRLADLARIGKLRARLTSPFKRPRPAPPPIAVV